MAGAPVLAAVAPLVFIKRNLLDGQPDWIHR